MAEAATPQTPDAPAPVALGGLEDRERSVLAQLARDLDAWVSFQGLRRQLGVHQQALVRTLRRLQSQGLVAHDGRGYQLTDQGAAALQGSSLRVFEAARLPLVTALLPPHVGAGDVAAQLSRRWFGGLRWYGQSEGPGETSLHWVADKVRVTVRVSAGSVQLEVEHAETDQARAFAAARPVLAALAELYGMGGSPPPAGPGFVLT